MMCLTYSKYKYRIPIILLALVLNIFLIIVADNLNWTRPSASSNAILFHARHEAIRDYDVCHFWPTTTGNKKIWLTASD